MTDDADRRQAWRFVVAMGVVSLWADVCYEGMRAAVGPYLEALGARAAVVGAIAGTGELVGFGLRYVAGRYADRTGRYWPLTFLGYGTNLIVAPLLAVVGSWPAVAALVMVERLGKAVRSPAKATIVAAAAERIGAGTAFGLHTAMDQIGGVSGPLITAAILAAGGGYRGAFAALTVAAALSLVALAWARRLQPAPAARTRPDVPWSRRALAGYLAGVALCGFGMADWALLAFHQVHVRLWSPAWVIAAYAAAMAVEGVAALIVGRLYDRWPGRGAGILALALLVGAAYPLAALSTVPAAVLVGVGLWALIGAAVEAVAKAGIAERVAPAARGSAYGLYYAVYGVAWWLGSLTLGVAYDAGPRVAAVVATVALVAAAAVLVVTGRSTGPPAAADLP